MSNKFIDVSLFIWVYILLRVIKIHCCNFTVQVFSWKELALNIKSYADKFLFLPMFLFITFNTVLYVFAYYLIQYFTYIQILI